MSRKLSLVSLLLLLLLPLLAFAADSAVDDATKDLEITGSTVKAVLVGEPSTLTLSVKNSGKLKATIHSLAGSLYEPKNPSQIIKNFTAQPVRVILLPNRSLNVTYKFKVELEPRKVGLLVNVDWYTEEDHALRTVGFNDVIAITSGDSLFDFQSLSIYLIFLGLIGGGGYYAYNTLVLGGKKPKKAKKVVPVAKDESSESSKPDTVQNEWIPDHVLKAQQASDAVKSGQSPKTLKRRKA